MLPSLSSIWRPTKGKFQHLEKVLNEGFFKGDPVFLHYTDKNGCDNIISNKKITDKRRNETRKNSKPGIYLCPSHHTFNINNVVMLLFIGNEMYADRGSHVVVFGFTPDMKLIDQPVTSGSWVRELIYPGGEIPVTEKNLIYCGPNPFIDVFEQNNPAIKN